MKPQSILNEKKNLNLKSRISRFHGFFPALKRGFSGTHYRGRQVNPVPTYKPFLYD